MLNECSPVTFEREGRVAFVTLNNPPLHVLNLAALSALDEALKLASEPAADGRRAALVVLRARGGKCFSAGTDVADHLPDKALTMLERFHGALWRLHTMPAATLAVLHGPALGGGAEAALLCDMIIASENATIGFPEIRVGCFPPVAMAALSLRIGHARAAEMVLTGEPVAASMAAGWGLVNAVTPAEALDTETRALTDTLLEHSPAVLGLAARGLRKVWDYAVERGLREAEGLYKDELMKMPDMEEGLRAFLEKRRPRWKG